MMRFHCLQHVPFESPGNIETWIRQKGQSISFTHLYDDATFPSVNDFDALIIMGGPMSIHDEKEFDWLKKEKEFIANAIQAQKKILGICLGAQLIADVLGAKVYQNKEKEIGFMPVHFTEKALANPLFQGFHMEETVFHWHGETFDLPKGAVHLAYTHACAHQAFQINQHIIGFQFHLEVTNELLKAMVKEGRHELAKEPFIQSESEIVKGLKSIERNKESLFGFLDRFFN
jgi:GMP synthase-like glutamine amidotransferase